MGYQNVGSLQVQEHRDWGLEMARSSGTTTRTQARERARRARQQVDAERDVRDRKVEDAATKFFVATDERDAIEKQLVGVEEKMASAIGELVDLRETAPRIAALLGIEVRDVRRLRNEHKKKEEASSAEVGQGDSEWIGNEQSSL